MAPAYEVGHLYRDVAAAKKDSAAKAGGKDQFLSWLNVNGRGMQAFGGVRWLGGTGAAPRIIVLVQSEPTGNFTNPWLDAFLPDKNLLLYWGDAQVANLNAKARGNAKLDAAKSVVSSSHRREHPLVLYFRREDKGWVRFMGLGTLADVRTATFLEDATPVTNRLAVVKMLPVDRVPVDWLKNWTAKVAFDSVSGAPLPYRNWVAAEQALLSEEEGALVEEFIFDAKQLPGSKQFASVSANQHAWAFDTTFSATASTAAHKKISEWKGPDLAKFDSADATHAAVTAGLAAYVEGRGFKPRSPALNAISVPFDLAWREDDSNWCVAEVKSLSADNQTEQIRRGIGQLLDYAERLKARAGWKVARLILVVAVLPEDFEHWKAVAARANVVIVHAPQFKGLFPSATAAIAGASIDSPTTNEESHA